MVKSKAFSLLAATVLCSTAVQVAAVPSAAAAGGVSRQCQPSFSDPLCVLSTTGFPGGQAFFDIDVAGGQLFEVNWFMENPERGGRCGATIRPADPPRSFVCNIPGGNIAAAAGPNGGNQLSMAIRW